jgi:hypothetical protein
MIYSYIIYLYTYYIELLYVYLETLQLTVQVFYFICAEPIY